MRKFVKNENSYITIQFLMVNLILALGIIAMEFIK